MKTTALITEDGNGRAITIESREFEGKLIYTGDAPVGTRCEIKIAVLVSDAPKPASAAPAPAPAANAAPAPEATPAPAEAAPVGETPTHSES